MTAAPRTSDSKAPQQTKKRFSGSYVSSASWAISPLILTLIFLSFTPAGADAARSTYFDVREVESSDLKPFTKWSQVLQRYRAQQQREASECTSAKCKAWRALLAKLDGKSAREQVEQVNRFVNSVPYIVDDRNWGKGDYWATPFEFLARNGDCEDYAITKYLSLKSLGIPLRDMRIIILQDMNLGGIIHAVLEVKIDGEAFILDNQAAAVVPRNKIYHYKPIYAINESAWWAFKK